MAGKAGPDDVAVWDMFSAHVLDRSEVKVIVAVVGLIDRRLFCADIVRPNRSARMFGSLGDKAATGEEIDKSWTRLLQGQCETVAWIVRLNNIYSP